MEAARDQAEMVRRAFAAWNARDLDALLACFTSDAEINSPFARSEGEPMYRGVDGVRAWYADIVETVRFVMEPHQFLSYRGLVLALVAAKAHGNESGVQLTQEYGMVYEFRGDKIARMSAYLDPAEAIEAMGRLARS